MQYMQVKTLLLQNHKVSIFIHKLLSMNVAKVRNENIQNQYEPSPISHQNAFASTVNENV